MGSQRCTEGEESEQKHHACSTCHFGRSGGEGKNSRDRQEQRGGREDNDRQKNHNRRNQPPRPSEGNQYLFSDRASSRERTKVSHGNGSPNNPRLRQSSCERSAVPTTPSLTIKEHESDHHHPPTKKHNETTTVFLLKDPRPLTTSSSKAATPPSRKPKPNPLVIPTRSK